MEITQLMSAMNWIEDDHQLVVDKLRALQQALGCLREPGSDAARFLRRLQTFNQAIAARFSAHVAQQEVHVLPYLQNNLPDEPGLVATLREEHEKIKSKLGEWDSCLKVALQLESVPHAVLLDILAYGWEVWELLDRHAHRETTALGRCFGRFLQAVPGM
jgi:hypothetical protein